ncbi:hypothetical protein SMALA_6481 [Streptomyces malaysiensis subsp. malaysiensis]|nr:hypothetical protein SMALA_6481 [Streptomyces malaysiensis]
MPPIPRRNLLKAAAVTGAAARSPGCSPSRRPDVRADHCRRQAGAPPDLGHRPPARRLAQMDRARRRRAHPAPTGRRTRRSDPRRGLRRPLRPRRPLHPRRGEDRDRLDLPFDCHKCQAEQRRWYGCAPSPHALSIGFGTDWSGLAAIQNLALVGDKPPG